MADLFVEKAQPLTRPTYEQKAVYFGSAFLVTLVPLYLYLSIFEMALLSNLLIFTLVTVFSSLIMTYAYHNVAFALKSRLDRDREEVLNNFLRQKKDQGEKKKLQEAQHAVTLKESIAFSILFNNVLFLLLVVVLGFFIFGSASATYNYIVTVSISSAALTFISTASLK
eukprot:TRINITY_DN841_c0_g1_i1.p2 TRINITY_DN841_c0_g1~~TRINITY_DN841_c0_g1_i1.p2  ORF type:complete len:169 (-),score=71.76 TRINITY_DN841_c0_g1_i1:30-536(-)